MKRKHKGSSLVLALGISLSLLILIMAVSTTLSAETKTSVNQQKKIQAYYIARGGAEAAAEWIKQQSNLSFPIESNNNSFENGSFDIDIHKDEIDSNKIIIKSTGKVNNGINSDITDTATMLLNAHIDNGNDISDITAAVWGINSVSIASSTIVGDVGTSSNINPITLNWDFNINGTIRSYIPIINNTNKSVNVSNLTSTYNFPTPNFSLYPYPEINTLNKKADITTNWENTNPEIYNNEYYDNITVTSPYNLKINAPSGTNTIIRIKNLNVNWGNLLINGSGDVSLFVDNITNLNGLINNSGLSKQLKLYCYNRNLPLRINQNSSINASLYIGNSPIDIAGSVTINGDIISTTSDNINLYGNANIYGILYAPNATITLYGSGKVKNGAIIGNNIIINSSGAGVEFPKNTSKANFLDKLPYTPSTTVTYKKTWK
ncbi:hypothetical protein CPAST_c14870 [Clostridium pasteurianum DSM 525 = ATCC 6013]|uniref:DUF7305 domain-containing protein n=1 Tax=Clostridium pasteurianum DSM 525 = ATCC 6013 TaxID=1262449 RepID=A0A0H3J3W3_CLOPA|nr:hypothetical protein [Clostridium pasteurianum]AJA47562.1 hypothetical protein CPAST_c14870 [Clostridium pasteurianum DSM 525 = ATCC 6013]AJA51550.1 hypothetical protein CLPA_c14870 [Clostridium pasteurianum DSM 525 = ATCC 6013]AOZ74877.1 hypothetical protein AQ983_07185 [Clostridium pasteurianum DSM 525 = ATCC 6013]AOZ78672.1 hypothetical protein AQ984_07175 [Clostridium pasteurianum]ELP58097.1 hypothetical protein F502_16660 [Clostridium pasteurianum DSM 525 = ATCC 6013]